MKIIELSIELHKKDGWSQAKFLARAYSDLVWTDSLDEALIFLKEGFAKFEEDEAKPIEEEKQNG